MGLRKWRLAQGMALGDKQRLMVSDQEGTTYHWSTERAEWVYIYTDGQLVESVFVRIRLTYQEALAAIEEILSQRTRRPVVQA